MVDQTKDLEIDLDEDLFDFGEAALPDAFDGDDDADLDEIFAAFQQVQLDVAQEEDESKEDDLADFFQPEEEVREPAVQARPAPQDVWTPERVIGGNGSTAPRQRRPETTPETTKEPRQVRAGTGLSRSALWTLVAVTSVNALVAIVTLSGVSTMRSSVLEVGRHVTATADEIRNGAYEQARVLNVLQTPVVPRDAEEHPTFDRARTEIASGQYADARRRLYALLSIIDRLDEEQRAKVEARAQFLLAEALHLEALERMEAEQ